MHSLGAVLLVAGGIAGADLPRGEVVERVACRADPSQTYALYLPAGYTPERGWPVLLVMDPRGRAVHALEPFRDAAEQLGWVVVSAHDTRSDEGFEPNQKALAALLPEIVEQLALAPRRLYLTGFSGTSRIAWAVAHRLAPEAAEVAGVIGVGGGITAEIEPDADTPFAYFGAAGTADFNFQEMRELEAKLLKAGARHRFVYFDGRHSWPPAAVCGEALEWMELDAMRRELVRRDDGFIARLLERRLAAAATLLSSGDPYEAQRAYASIGRDFAGLAAAAAAAAVADARRRATELAATKQVAATAARLDKLGQREVGYRRRFATTIDQLLATMPPLPPATRTIRDLDLPTLVRRTASADRLEADAARRQLAHAFAVTGFYVPRDLLERNRSLQALAVLEVAAFIVPDSPSVAYQQAQAEAARGHAAAALAALARAIAAGFRDRAAIESEPRFERLRASPGYGQLLDGLP